MGDDRSEQVKKLFDAALVLNTNQREALLDTLDPSLRKEVESLIASHEVSSSFLEQPPPVDSVTITRHKDVEVDDRQIGPYRILSEIGQGGMGVVYEAEQEKPVHRRVALKLIKWGMDTKAVIARFESERQALALMNHPNIASVYDAGATGEGRPYFAMELVHGEPITEYCDKNRLTIKERLGLFIQVCEGVQHAHQKGIIHRDIKPSNILITIQDDKPVPKIIDFGVAKATSQRLTERTVYTELGQLIGTPEYMSPEQAEMTGIDIDTRTDVYSLGMVLYELLVGAQPFDAKELLQLGFDELRRKIREEEPPKPSTKLSRLGELATSAAKSRRVELRSLERDLQGDLDWITMKALEKDRTRRYGSPSDFAADIERHLKHEPVLAGPPSTVYRATKFVRRHLVGVASVTAIALLLVALLAGMTVQATRIARERDRAEKEAAKATAINEFLQETLGSADPYGELGREVTVVEALGEAVKKIEEAFKNQPEIEAAVKTTIGNTYSNLSRYDDAEALLTSALEIRKATLGAEHRDVAECLYRLGELRLVRGDYKRNDYAMAEKDLREALVIRSKLFGKESLEVAEVLIELAGLQYYRSDYEEAEKLYREVLKVRRTLLGDEDGAVAESIHGLAVMLWLQKDLDEAERLLLESLDIARRVGKDQVTTAGLHNLAMFYLEAGDFENAEKVMHEALNVEREVSGDDHHGVAFRMQTLAFILNKKGSYQAAEKQAREALARYQAHFGDRHQDTAISMRILADVLRNLGEYEESEQLYRMSIDILEELLGADHRRTASARNGLGVLLMNVARYDEAEKELLFAFQFFRDNFGEADRRTRETISTLSALYEAWGKPEKAGEYRAMLAKEESE
jgi:serine/threonine protein kinase/tetratricopeptide (TPR) repeat protein